MEDRHAYALDVIEKSSLFHRDLILSSTMLGIGSKVAQKYLPVLSELINPEAGDIKGLNELLTFTQWTGLVTGSIGVLGYISARTFINANKNKKGE